MTNLEIGLLTAVGGGAFGFMVKMIVDALKNKNGNGTTPICKLDRSGTIFKIGELHKAEKDNHDLLSKIEDKIKQDLAVSEKNAQNLNNLYIALNNMINVQKQSLEEQKRTNDLLTKIQKNGSG